MEIIASENKLKTNFNARSNDATLSNFNSSVSNGTEQDVSVLDLFNSSYVYH